MKAQTLLAIVLSVGQPVAAVAQESEGGDSSPVLEFLIAWLPFLLLIGIWVYTMRRMGAKNVGVQVERSLEHMDRIEQQNEEILEVLRSIESSLPRDQKGESR